MLLPVIFRSLYTPARRCLSLACRLGAGRHVPLPLPPASPCPVARTRVWEEGPPFLVGCLDDDAGSPAVDWAVVVPPFLFYLFS